MGGSSWSNESYTSRSAPRAKAPVHEVFTSSNVDPALDPHGVKVRESRDSAGHPESNAIAVFFDVTGSMGGIPVMFAKEKLGGLMRLLIGQSVIPDPQVLFGAVGDAFTDRSPFQVAQFESGLEMDDWLTKIHLEGGGGGGNHESYEIPFWWSATHISMDCWEKRGKKGYLFVIGDERCYPELRSEQIKKIIGENIQNMPVADVIAMAQEKFEVFKICVRSSSYPDGNLPAWKELMGERAIYLEDPSMICEFIASQIASCEGSSSDKIKAGLLSSGMNDKSANQVVKSLVVSSNTAVSKGTVTGNLVRTTDTKRSERL